MTITIAVDAGQPRGPLPKFWRSTGFTPAELLLLPEMAATLDHLAALPDRGVEFLRVHYLLNLVTWDAAAGYDWTLLDEALDVMVSRKLRPFFEIMGNPSNRFTDFHDLGQLRAWRDMVSELAARCIEHYGQDEVRAWYWESWNEPDLPWWPWGDQAYCNYYDACVAGLAAVDPALIIGGPGTARPVSETFKAFVAHCDTGTNILTGETGVRLDFISVHEKGAKKDAEDLTPDTHGIIQREMAAIEYLRRHHPRLARTPFINNECDPQVGWIIPHTWHALPYFAGIIVKIIDQHLRLMIDQEGIDYPILSNDNGFIGRWGHRTMLAYFGDRPITAAQADHKTDLAALARMRAADVPFDLVKKPGLTVMEFLSLLGPTRLAVTATPTLDPACHGVGAIATRRGDGVVILAYNSVDRIWTSGVSDLTFTVSGLTDGDYTMGVFAIDEDNAIAYWAWEAADAPTKPTAADLTAMRAGEDVGLVRQERVSVRGGRADVALPLKLPAAILIVLEPMGGAADVSNLRAAKHRGINGTDDVTLLWDGSGTGVVRWQVDRWEADAFRPIGPARLSRLYLDADRASASRYRVRALALDGSVLATSQEISA